MKYEELLLKSCLVVVCILLVLIGCSGQSTSQDNHYTSYSFLQTIQLHEYKQNGIHEQTNIYVDKETGVNYICIVGRISGDLYFSIAPRYGADGEVIITK